MALKNKYTALLFSLIATLLVGCSSNGCHENRSSIPKAGLYAYNLPTSTIKLDSVTLYGVGQKENSLLLDCARNVTQFTLPFRNDADTTQFVIQYDSYQLATRGVRDTLTIIYERYPYFISGECGVVFNYAIDTVQHTVNLLDSVAIVTPEVTNQDVETMRLYYYVAL